MRIGGSFAPPLTNEKLKNYKVLIGKVDPESRLRSALDTCYKCAEGWWTQPDSTGVGEPHPVGEITDKEGRTRPAPMMIPLDAPIAKALDEYIPWDDEIETFATIFEAITDISLRNCAFHLLWHVKELALDREPITADKL
jgi:hypothetical protein